MFGKASAKLTRGRRVEIHPAFHSWLIYFAEHDIEFRCNKKIEAKIKNELGVKSEYQNTIRHTSLSFHIRKFNKVYYTSSQGGTSLDMVENHYNDTQIPPEQGELLYDLTPEKYFSL